VMIRDNQLQAGASRLESALELAVAIDDPVEAAECCAGLTTAYLWQGAMRRLERVLTQRLAFAERCHDPYQLRHVYTWLAVARGLRGDTDEAERLLDREARLVERLASPEPLAYVHFSRGALAQVRGDSATAEALIRQALATFREVNPHSLGWYLGWLCITLAAQDKQSEAAASMDELAGLIDSLPMGSMQTSEPLTHLSAAALELGDLDRLEWCYPRLLAFEGQFHDFLVDRLLGQIETRRRAFDAARAHLDRAEATARAEGLRWELAHLLKARESTTSHALPAGLTQREVDVLRLLASGSSNRVIAAALSLSESTVAHHVTSIFNKTGANNRAAATAFAFRHALTVNP
jgi:ATP/maltotriose-dependent transcriptional regulator MalT